MITFETTDDSEAGKIDKAEATTSVKHAVFLTDYNYFSGLRVTTYHAKMEESTDENIMQVFPYIKIEDYGIDETDFEIVNKTINDEFDYQETGGFYDNGGYIQFFPADMSQTDALNMADYMVKGEWFKSNMLISVFEFMFYNANLELLAIYNFKVASSSSGILTTKL